MINSTKISEISIHALREEGDLKKTYEVHAKVTISIHALREEGDRTSTCKLCLTCNFYPRPPRGGRPGLEKRYRHT